MDTQRKEQLKAIFEEWVVNQVDTWIGEYEAWDNLIEDEELDEDEWEWIRNNLKYKVNVEEE